MNRQQRRAKGMTRRDFMKAVAVVGAAASTSGLLQSCGSSSSSGQMETKTLYFDHSHLNPDNHDFYLVVGSKHIPLPVATKQDIEKAKATNSFLKAVPDSKITHIGADLLLPAKEAQLCYVRHIPKGKSYSSNWKMSTLFIHFPKSSLEKAYQRRGKSSSQSVKARFYGVNYKASSPSDYVNESAFVGPTDTASSIVYMSPEVMSLEPDSGAHISNNIIGQQSSTLTFSQAIQAQGDDWATYQVMTDPTTGKPYTDSKGSPVQMPIYSDMTMQFGGPAVTDSVYNVKQDTTLYTNVSNVTDPSQMQGKIITVQNGTTYTDPTKSKARRKYKSEGFSYSLTDVCTGGGYKLELDEVEKDSKGNIVATFMCTNSYVRHLGMFVRYLDANNQPIPTSSIGYDFFNSYPDCFTLGYDSGQYYKCLKAIGPEMVVMGIPVSSTSEDVKVPMPQMASKMQIIADTIGYGGVSDVKSVGVTLTAIFDLTIPAVFLAFGAGSSFAAYSKEEGLEWFLEALEVFFTLISDIVQAITFHDPKAFVELGVSIGYKLLAHKALKFVAALVASIAAAEAEELIPYVGAILNAVGCAAIVSQLIQTEYAIFSSPWNYVKTLAVTHDVTVTINHDPLNPEGFPSVATYFIVTAVCKLLDSNGNVVDSSTPYQIRQPMPSTTTTAPIVVTFENIPYGGSISLAVGFYSDTGWLAGNATLKDGDNTQNSFTMTITQNQVPLTSNTTYSHKEKMSLDASGNHVWLGTKTPPVPTPLGQCGQTPGQLCQIIDITDSNTFASVGYTWQSYSQSAGGQMYYFGNVSSTGTPESSAIVSMPMTTQPRIVYDLLGDSTTQRNFYLDVASGNIIRQIRLSLQGKPSYDAPNSNKAWGKLNFSSDSMLLHPNNSIVSINASLSKIEVLKLPSAPTTDANAPVASVYAGKGIREGLLDGPLCAALTPKGEILILETANNRIQAFDTGGNPVMIFNNKTSYFAPLKYSATQYKYIDMATEYTGYIYLLSYLLVGSNYQFYLDIYTPDGQFLTRTSNFSAAKITVSFWRDVFAANMEVLRLPNGNLPASGIAEPSISRWIPSTP